MSAFLIPSLRIFQMQCCQSRELNMSRKGSAQVIIVILNYMAAHFSRLRTLLLKKTACIQNLLRVPPIYLNGQSPCSTHIQKFFNSLSRKIKAFMKDGLSNYPGRYWGNKPQLDASSGKWSITNNSLAHHS